MINLKNCFLIGLILVSGGCGQKGPLYIDDTQDGTAERAQPKDEKRLKELEELEQQNESQPVITY